MIMESTITLHFKDQLKVIEIIAVTYQHQPLSNLKIIVHCQAFLKIIVHCRAILKIIVQRRAILFSEVVLEVWGTSTKASL